MNASNRRLIMTQNYLWRWISFATVGAILISAASVLTSPVRAESSSTPAPPPTAIQQTVTGVATVESVDQTTRQVLLSDPSGNLLTVTAGPGIRNLAQVHAGDQVHVIYQRAVAVRLASPGGSLPSPSREAAA